MLVWLFEDEVAGFCWEAKFAAARALKLFNNSLKKVLFQIILILTYFIDPEFFITLANGCLAMFGVMLFAANKGLAAKILLNGLCG